MLMSREKFIKIESISNKKQYEEFNINELNCTYHIHPTIRLFRNILYHVYHIYNISKCITYNSIKC
jgi:hypothetical protein